MRILAQSGQLPNYYHWFWYFLFARSNFAYSQSWLSCYKTPQPIANLCISQPQHSMCIQWHTRIYQLKSCPSQLHKCRLLCYNFSHICSLLPSNKILNRKYIFPAMFNLLAQHKGQLPLSSFLHIWHQRPSNKNWGHKCMS